VKQQFNLTKPISERMACLWMNSDHRWRKTPIGQYSGGHERDDVVNYHQNIFPPAISELEPLMVKYEGKIDPKTQLYIDNEMQETLPPLVPTVKRVVLWFHDESTFYAQTLMVTHLVSAQYGWLESPDG
jgi:hypothetical protein